MKKSKVMDHVSSQGCQDLEDEDKDEDENSIRAGTPPKITKKNSFSREDLSKTSIEMRQSKSRNMNK